MMSESDPNPQPTSPSRMFIAVMIAAFVVLALSPFFQFLSRLANDVDGAAGWENVSERKPMVLTGRLPSIDGETIYLAEFEGNVVFLNFWATWCPPCIEEMPSMEKLYDMYRDEGLRMLAVTSEQKPVVERFLKKRGFDIPVALDPERKLVKEHDVNVLPTTIILDKKGREVLRLENMADWSDPRLIQRFESLLKE